MYVYSFNNLYIFHCVYITTSTIEILHLLIGLKYCFIICYRFRLNVETERANNAEALLETVKEQKERKEKLYVRYWQHEYVLYVRYRQQ